MPSTVVADIHYDAPSGTLKITFVSGSEYSYLDVPQSIFNGLKKSGSKGNYLNRYIKGHFNFKKIK
jgi:KTSC domain